MVLGALATGLWLCSVRHPALVGGVPPLTVGACVAVPVALTTVNLVLRWFRWHFLVRRFTRSIGARDSVRVYFATLPALLTPFYVGELLRVFLVRRRYPGATGYLAAVWLIERMVDAAVVLTLLAAVRWWRAEVVVLTGLSWAGLVALGWLAVRRFGWSVLRLVAAMLVPSALAWSLPIVSLREVVLLLGGTVSVSDATAAFSSGTLFGGLTGLPLGVAVTGSVMILRLEAAGVGQGVAVLAVALFRLGTAWFAVGLGVACLLVWRGALVALVRSRRGRDRFDEIAPGYKAQIPDHVRQRLLVRKVDLTERLLREQGIAWGARGLDVGCGQGWYARELARRGYDMCGVDRSAGQLRQATEASGPEELGLGLVGGDGVALPFASGTFDFAYSINVLHHMREPAARARALGEIVRVLRPGGVFVLHEINVTNPLFRFYMGYVFPFVRTIDDGTEEWVSPRALPAVAGGSWEPTVEYLTFLPDFLPERILGLFARLEGALERSRLRHFSAHFVACLVKARPQG